MTTTDRTGQMLPPMDDRISSVLRYWDGLRAHRVAPPRIEISPTAIARHLSRVCILERPRGGEVTIRLAGATVSTRAGMELRGMPFRSLFDRDDCDRAVDAAETAITTPAVSILSLGRKGRMGLVKEAMMAILPLTDTRGALTRALAIYSEYPCANPHITGTQGGFTITESWSLDIPETGPILGPIGEMGAVKPISTRIMRPRLAIQTAQEVQVQDLPERPRPVLQVIDGGLA